MPTGATNLNLIGFDIRFSLHQIDFLFQTQVEFLQVLTNQYILQSWVMGMYLLEKKEFSAQPYSKQTIFDRELIRIKM